MIKQFKQYKRKGLSEMRPVTDREVKDGADMMKANRISISDDDLVEGSPKVGDMIARNPVKHTDQWLVTKEYFNKNLEAVYDDK